MALNLPKPVNTYAGEDELRPKTNGINGHAATPDVEDNAPSRPSDRLKTGIIYPPREIRGIIDKTANHISKSPTPLLLEEKIREHQKTDPKFAFLNDADAFHKYYRYMIEKIKEDVMDGPIAATPVTDTKPKFEDTSNAYEPKQLEFLVDMPGVTAMDLDILRLTALFHARRGRSFLSSLSIREGRNYQFDFLRPTHSLFGYYNRMVESYTKIMQPPPGLLEHLIKETSVPDLKWKTLEEGRNRAEWERGRRKREDARMKEKDDENTAMSAIDWQDFVLVETIEFTQNDMDLELPPPTSVDKLRSMSMAEKRMASMVMEETGAGGSGGPSIQPPIEEEMEIEEEDEEVRLQRIKAEQEQTRAREVQRAAMESRGMKIKKDYVPKGIQRAGSAATQKCPYCGQLIPENELSEHIRIELLDPKWKEQKRALETRRNQHLQMQQGADVSASLRNLASQRTDLFGDEIDEEERKRREEAAKQARRDREKIIWDGHTATAAKTSDTFQSQFSGDDQIRKMHSRIGLTDAPDQSRVGPQAGPGIAIPPPMAAGLPTPSGGTAYSGATISAGPTGPSTREYISAPYDQSFAPAPSSGPAVHPTRAAQMSISTAAGQTRPAPEDDDDDEEPSEKPVFKRPKIDKLPYGQLYSEVDWMSLHPDSIVLSVQLPDMPEKPEWKLNGSIILVPDLPVKTMFSTVRERIKRIVDADLPISRLRLDYNGKVMNNSATLASVNLDDGDLLVMAVRKK